MRNDLVVFSHHRGLAWDLCRQYHYWHYELGLKSPKEDNNDFLFGSAFHTALEAYYKSNRTMLPNEAITIFDNYLEENCVDNLQLSVLSQIFSTGRNRLRQYILADRKLKYEIVGQELPFLVGVSNELELTEDLDREDLIFYLSGKIDLLIQTDEGIMICDFKTTNQEKNTFLSFMKFDEQLLTYSAYAQFKYEDFAGTLYTVFSKRDNSSEPIFREPIIFSEVDIDNLIEKCAYRAQEYYAFKSHSYLFQRRTGTPMECSSCSFRDPCIAKRKGRRYMEILEKNYIKIDKFDWQNEQEV